MNHAEQILKQIEEISKLIEEQVKRGEPSWICIPKSVLDAYLKNQGASDAPQKKDRKEITRT